VPTLEPSAVGFHTLEVQRTMRTVLGVPSELFTAEIHPDLAGRAHPYRDYGAAVASGPDDVLIYQLAVGSDVGDFVMRQRQPLVVNYHNLTPTRFLDGWDPGSRHAVDWGRRQLGELGAKAELAVPVSSFNGAELVAAGYRRVVVVPVLVDLEALAVPGDAGVARRLAAAKSGGGGDWLFVGRLAPNKCQHEVVKAFAVYRRCFDPKARLWLVGSSSSTRYVTALERLVAALELGDVVTLTGSVSQAALVSYYRGADVFVCLSQHEGFCVPLLEAMWHRVPVVALATSAVPETLGSAGLLLPEVSGAAVVAAAVDRVLGDGSLRDALVARGLVRVEEFSLARTRARFAEAITEVAASAA
jgi:glycosyltransferase involved in cell wall biosynthesis